MAVLEYRAARRAIEVFNRKGSKTSNFKELEENPYLLRMLSQMHRAQEGLPLHGGTAREIRAEGLAVAAANARDDEDE